MSLHASELVAVAYFAYLFVAGLVLHRKQPAVRAARLLALVSIGLLLSLRDGAWLSGTAWLREWMPAILLPVGYWASGFFFRAPMTRLEDALLRADRRLFDRGLGRLLDRAPRLCLELLEACYLCCYPLVPAGFVLLLASGHGDAGDRYWTLALAAAFLAYACLPWVRTRPPRVLEEPGVMDRRGLAMRRLNLRLLRYASIQANTLPSGHAAAALAAALAVGERLPAAGIGFGILALGIGVASVAGRYHYALDVILGLALALVVWAVVR